MKNGYICLYVGTRGTVERAEVYAMTTFEAQCEAAKILKVKPAKQYKISVYLAELAGVQVVEKPLF